MASVWKQIQDYCAGMLRHRPEPAHAARPESGGLRPRRESRVAKQEACGFALTHASNPSEIVCEEGAGMTVNLSPSGMQLLLGVAPACGQVLEVHLGSTLHRSVSLVEVRWTKPVRADLHDQLHLVGCRLTFGPLRYWAV